MPVTAIIAQARMGSTRLPGKVLKRLGDRSVLAHVARRACAVPNVDKVCIATSTLLEDDAVAEEAERCGVEAFRGDPTDVLQRYVGAAHALGADTVMRLTCDCPLIDPIVCGQVLKLQASADVGYASNVGAAQWPHGLDCEAFTAELLNRADAQARAANEREHVTLWMRRNDAVRKAYLEGPGAPASHERWTLDYPEDFAFLERLFDLLPAAPALPNWRQVLETLDAHPELNQINLARRAESVSRSAVLAAAQPDPLGNRDACRSY